MVDDSRRPRYSKSVNNSVGNNTGGTVIQAVHAHFGRSATDSSKEDQVVTSMSPSPMAWLVGILVVLFIVIASCIASLAEKAKNSFPEEVGIRPLGASERAVKSAVVDKLQSCAQAVVLKPLNCPQSAAGGSRVRSVRWLVHGNPVDGVQFAWHNDRFYVRGNTVMTVSYLDYIQNQKFETQVVAFQAEVAWKDGGATVTRIYAVDAISDGAVKKREFFVSEELARAMLRDFFYKCAASTVSPMPPDCPNTLMVPTIREAVWKFGGDPTLNIRQDFDGSSGILHVVGSFAATVDYRSESIFSGQPRALSGDYDALFIKDNDALRLLQIRAS